VWRPTKPEPPNTVARLPASRREKAMEVPCLLHVAGGKAPALIWQTV
jgi:hypothetical protein